MLINFDLTVSFDDGATEKVTADQRDLAQWEIQSFGRPVSVAFSEVPHLLFRFLAWNALKRQKRTELTWEAFSEVAAEVSFEDGAEPDPGSPAAPVAGS